MSVNGDGLETEVNVDSIWEEDGATECFKIALNLMEASLTSRGLDEWAARAAIGNFLLDFGRHTMLAVIEDLPKDETDDVVS